MNISKNNLFQLSNITLFGFAALGLLLVHFGQDLSIQELFFLGSPVYIQLGIGFLYGAITALLAVALVNLKTMDSMTGVFIKMFSKLNVRLEDIVFYSFCAGFGEEMLFRAGLQPIFGIWPTALFFVAIHGYLNFKNWKMMLYGVLLVFISAGFGYLFNWYGIFTAIVAHMVFDIIMFYYLIFVRAKRMDTTASVSENEHLTE